MGVDACVECSEVPWRRSSRKCAVQAPDASDVLMGRRDIFRLFHHFRDPSYSENRIVLKIALAGCVSAQPAAQLGMLHSQLCTQLVRDRCSLCAKLLQL